MLEEENAEYTLTPNGIEISFSTPVNDRQEILMKMAICDDQYGIISTTKKAETTKVTTTTTKTTTKTTTTQKASTED